MATQNGHQLTNSIVKATRKFFLGGTDNETVSGAGAVSVDVPVTRLVTTASGGDALTLADGAEGQVKYIYMKTDGGDGTLTPTNLHDGTTITFDDANDDALLIFTDSAWKVVGTPTATVA